MNTFFKLAAPAAFALTALSVQAQTIETDYPRAVPAGPVAATVAPLAPTAEGVDRTALVLIQSNAEGPRIDPAYADDERSLTRSEVQADAKVHVQWNAPDARS
ncbi:MAG TPA: hypothetical protein VK047_13950 [Zeimonas sp.]|nr:hypothetical protein [Zeimonas sp.]